MTSKRPRLCSIACWMNNNGAFTPDWKACNWVTEAISAWRRCLVWMWTLSPGGEASCSVRRWFGVGSGVGEVAEWRWKKNARNPETPGRLAPGGHGRRSERSSRLVDRQTAAHDQSGVGSVGLAGLPQYRPSVVGRNGLRTARQSQESLPTERAGASTAVQLLGSSTPTVQPQRLSDYQRRHKEERTGGSIQEQRSTLEPATDPGPRP